MATSYPQSGRGVKAPGSSKTSAAASGKSGGAPATSSVTSAVTSPRERPRKTETFVAYYWEAYNEIVEPRRFDHYLIRRWLPDLRALGFAIVKAVRDRCYFHPETGTIRNSVDLDMEELAAAVGVSRATLFREFDRNQALAQFISKKPLFDVVGGHAQQVASRFTVCMDDPIHPDDMERYEELRAIKEMERPGPDAPAEPGKKQRRTPLFPESQSETLNKSGQNGSKIRESQSETLKPGAPVRESQNETPYPKGMQPQSETPIDYLPSGVLTKESLTPPAAAFPPINPPEGEPEPASELARAWEAAQQDIQVTVNKPTYQSHMRHLRPLCLEPGDTDGSTVVVIWAPSAFTREWVEKRHRETLAVALSAALEREVDVRLTTVDTAPSVTTAATVTPVATGEGVTA